MKLFVIDDENEIYGIIKDPIEGSIEIRPRLIILSPVFDSDPNFSRRTIRITGKKSMENLRNAINEYLGEEHKS